MTTAMNEAEKTIQKLEHGLSWIAAGVGFDWPTSDITQSVALLRRQAEQIKVLREALEELKSSVNFKAALIVANAEVMKVALADDQLWAAVDGASAALAATKEET